MYLFGIFSKTATTLEYDIALLINNQANADKTHCKYIK